MERQQLLKVMVPVGAFALLLIMVGVVIALNTGSTPSSSASNTPSGTTPEIPGKTPPAPANKFDFPLDGPEWKDVVGYPGLKYWDVKLGDGKECQPGATVTAQYTGWRPDGFSFDNPQKHGPSPIAFSLNGVVAGWTHGIPGMKVGGIRRLYIPSSMGYGARQQGRDIPPHTDLIFEIELAGVS